MCGYSHIVTETNFISYCQTFLCSYGGSTNRAGVCACLLNVWCLGLLLHFLKRIRKRFLKNNSLNMPCVIGNLQVCKIGSNLWNFRKRKSSDLKRWVNPSLESLWFVQHCTVTINKQGLVPQELFFSDLTCFPINVHDFRSVLSATHKVQ